MISYLYECGCTYRLADVEMALFMIGMRVLLDAVQKIPIAK